MQFLLLCCQSNRELAPSRHDTSSVSFRQSHPALSVSESVSHLVCKSYQIHKTDAAIPLFAITNLPSFFLLRHVYSSLSSLRLQSSSDNSSPGPYVFVFTKSTILARFMSKLSQVASSRASPSSIYAEHTSSSLSVIANTSARASFAVIKLPLDAYLDISKKSYPTNALYPPQ